MTRRLTGRTAAPQVHLHVGRLVVDAAAERAIDLPAFPAALQQALAAHLAGARPAVNHTTPADDFAATVGGHLAASLRRGAAE